MGHRLASFLKKNEENLNLKFEENLDLQSLAAEYIRQHREDKAGHPLHIYPAAAIKGSNCNCVLYYVFTQRYWKRTCSTNSRAARTVVQVNKSDAMSCDEFLEMCQTNKGIAATTVDHHLS